MHSSFKISSFAHADYITWLVCTTIPSLLRLITMNICSSYADHWKVNFGIQKTKGMISGMTCFEKDPERFINGGKIETVKSLESLKVSFDVAYVINSNSRNEKCKPAYYSLRNAGKTFPGCASDVKAYLWNSMYQSLLMYGFDSISIEKILCITSWTGLFVFACTRIGCTVV